MKAERGNERRERRLQRDALIISPLSHMQPPSSPLVWEQGLSFADPVLWVCDPSLPTPFANLKLKTWLNHGVSHRSAVGRESSGNLCLQPGHSSRESSIWSNFIKNLSPPPHPRAMLPKSWVSLLPRVQRWGGVVWVKVKQQIFTWCMGFFVLTLLFLLPLSAHSHQSEKLLLTFLNGSFLGLSGPQDSVNTAQILDIVCQKFP